MEEPITKECDLQDVNSLVHSDCQVITKTSQLDDEPEQASENHQNDSGTSPRPTKSEEAENEKPCKEDSPASNTIVNSEYQVITKTSELEAQTADSEHQLELSANALKPEESAEKKGGYDYNLVSGKLPEDLENCTICHMIPRKPAKVPCCGNVFCQSCIISHSQKSNRCPLCREELNTELIQIVDKKCERRIMNLVVHCVNQSLGCDWTGELRDVENQSHIKNTCEYQITECEFKFAGCDFKGPKRLMFKHIQEDVSNHMSRMARSITRGRAELVHLRSECADLKSRLRFYQRLGLGLVGVVLVIIIAISLLAIIFSTYNAQLDTKLDAVAASNQRTIESLNSSVLVQLSDLNSMTAAKTEGLKNSILTQEQDLKVLRNKHGEKLGEIDTKVVKNQQALGYLERYIDEDIARRLQEQESKLKDSEHAIALLELDNSEMKSKLSECVHDLEILKSTVKKVEWDIADLKTGLIKSLDDVISTAICTIFPRQITNLLHACPIHP